MQYMLNEIRRLEKENKELKERLEKSVELPCKVGNDVYALQNSPKPKPPIFECKVHNIRLEIIKGAIRQYELFCFNQFKGREYLRCEDKGKTWFLTKDEAVAKLKELEDK